MIVSYIKLFMTTMKVKNGNQYKIKKSQNGGENNVDKIFTSRVEQRYIPNTTPYVELFMNTIKIKDFCNRYQCEMQKSWDGGGNNAYQIFSSRVEQGNIPDKISYVKLFMTTMKMKNNFYNGYQYEIQKSQDGGGNNAYKIIMCRVEERNIICKHKTCLELFIATMNKKKLSESSKK